MKVTQIEENTGWRDWEKGNGGEARRETSGKELIKRTYTGNWIFKPLQWLVPGPTPRYLSRLSRLSKLKIFAVRIAWWGGHKNKQPPRAARRR
jgi:hypothetical protein